MSQNLPPEAQALLEQLNPVVAPPPVGLWPLAPGWWFLLALVVMALGILAVAAVRHHRANRYRRQALAELDALPKDSNYVQQLARLLKRTAITAYPEAQDRLPGLFGMRWLTFLNSTCPKPAFNEAEAILLTNAIYRPSTPADSAVLEQSVRYWIGHHRRSKKQLQLALQSVQGEEARV